MVPSLPPVAERAPLDRFNGDPEMPVAVRLPAFEYRYAANDLAASWAAVVETDFGVRARALIARRAAEAGQREARDEALAEQRR